MHPVANPIPAEINDPILLERINRKTQEYMRHRLHLFANDLNGGQLRTELKIPYLPLTVPQANWIQMLQEALHLSSLFVSHRSSDSEGWRSLCLHGIDATKTLSCDRYGYKSEQTTPYVWTEVSQKCPETLSWLKELKNQGFFTEFYRVRFMWLEPGGYIKFHQDREDGKTSLGPLNLALNMPKDCFWLFKKWGSVPFDTGSAIAVDVSNQHGVWNCSEIPRIHLIIHGKYGPAYYKALEKDSQRLLEKLDRNALKNQRPPELAIWQYVQTKNDSDLEQKISGITKHFLKLKASSEYSLSEDYSLKRILERALRNDATWAVVVAPGTVVNDHFFKDLRLLLQKADPNIFMFAHLLDRDDRGYGLHEQIFAVNVVKWSIMGCPNIGWPKEGPKKILAGERSPGNVHDDYTPLYIRPAKDLREIKDTLLGWEFINRALEYGFSIENFPEKIRSSKFFLYPEQNPTELHREIDLLKSSAPQKASLLSSKHREKMDFLRMEAFGHNQKTFLFNTEGLGEFRSEHKGKPLDHLFTLAAGFKDLALLHHHGHTSQTRITYFDISPATLFIKQNLFEQWNTENLPDFFHGLLKKDPEVFQNSIFAFDMNDIEALWARELNFWGGQKSFTEIFERARPLQKRFIQMDILKNPSWFSEEIGLSPGKNHAIWYSNCFNYTPSLAQYDWSEKSIENVGQKFLNGLLQSSIHAKKEIFMYGEDILSGTKADHCGHSIKSYFS